MIEINILNSELPHRIKIDRLEGAGRDIKGATMAALSVGRKIPIGMRDARKTAAYIFWHYESSPHWRKLISLLENGYGVVCPECLEICPDDERVKAGMKCVRCAS